MPNGNKKRMGNLRYVANNPHKEGKTYLNIIEAIKKRTILAEKNTLLKRHIEILDDGNATKFWKFSKNMMNGRKENTNSPAITAMGSP